MGCVANPINGYSNFLKGSIWDFIPLKIYHEGILGKGRELGAKNGHIGQNCDNKGRIKETQNWGETTEF